MSHKAHTWLLWSSIVGACVAIVVSMVATSVYSSHLANDRKAEQIAGCERANVQRAYINRLLSTHPDLGLPAIPIPDCEEIIK